MTRFRRAWWLATARGVLLAQTRQLARHEQTLQMLLSHRDPHLTLGGLVARLVRDGLDRYDPVRPRRARRTDRRGSEVGEQTERTSARRETEAVQRSVARAKGGEVERLSKAEEEDASPAVAVRDSVPDLPAAKRATEDERRSTQSTAVRGLVLRSDSAPKRPSEVEHGSATPATSPRSGGHTATRSATPTPGVCRRMPGTLRLARPMP